MSHVKAIHRRCGENYSANLSATALAGLAKASKVSSKVGRQPSPGYPASLPSLPLSGLIGIKIFVVGRDGLRLGPDRAFVIE